MSYQLLFLSGAVGFLGLVAASLWLEPEASVMTLEDGLGEKVVTTRL